MNNSIIGVDFFKTETLPEYFSFPPDFINFISLENRLIYFHGGLCVIIRVHRMLGSSYSEEVIRRGN